MSNPLDSRNKSIIDLHFFRKWNEKTCNDLSEGCTIQQLAKIADTLLQAAKIEGDYKAVTSGAIPDYRRVLIANFIAKSSDDEALGPPLPSNWRRLLVQKAGVNGEKEISLHNELNTFLPGRTELDFEDVEIPNEARTQSCPVSDADVSQKNSSDSYLIPLVLPDGSNVDDISKFLKKVSELRTFTISHLSFPATPHGPSDEMVRITCDQINAGLRVNFLDLTNMCGNQPITKSSPCCFGTSESEDYRAQGNLKSILDFCVARPHIRENLKKIALPICTAWDHSTALTSGIIKTLATITGSSHIQSLVLKGTNLCIKGKLQVTRQSIETLRASLRCQRVLKSLDISDNGMGDDLCSEFISDLVIAAERGMHLRSLRLSGNGAGPKTALQLSRLLESCSLVTVDISDNCITGSHFDQLVTSMSYRKSVQHFACDGNRSRRSGFFQFSKPESLTVPQLNSLDAEMQSHPTFDEIMRVLVNIAFHSRYAIAADCNTQIMSQPTTTTGATTGEDDDVNRIQQFDSRNQVPTSSDIEP
eukprot:TRINITY_DN11750_c0_g1_i1.p1 TRINITY_DN11750_c0_g1~~TRINITY_DN11750_c0_g1_i1.p1  ORF type:complete len:533 (+),score=89.43 TRINITY_DN11750_c0_g1_i1:363-1961(+)